MFKNILIILFLSLTVQNAFAVGSTPLQPITTIRPIIYQGVPGIMVSNCTPTDSTCITTPAGANGGYFFIAESDALYRTILSVFLTSLASSTPVQINGSGVCIPACSNGYEKIGWVDIKK